MEQKIAPSERKAQEIQALVQGQLDAQSGEELLSTLGIKPKYPGLFYR
jgi:hypothetical protein